MDGSMTWIGERAILRRFAGDLTVANARALASAERIRSGAHDEVVDCIPGARSVLIVLRSDEPGPALRAAIDADDALPDGRAGAEHVISVRYDGPDLNSICAANDLTHDEAIELHRAGEYTVGFIGFSPGFPYLLGLHPRLHTPRLETPRASVPPGSVAIGGGYAGIYPRATPGGWRIIGSTDAVLFDVARAEPALMRPGDRVRFTPA